VMSLVTDVSSVAGPQNCRVRGGLRRLATAGGGFGTYIKYIPHILIRHLRIHES